MKIDETHSLSIRHAKSPVESLWAFERSAVGTVPAFSRINWLIISTVRRGDNLGKFSAGAGARVDGALVAKLFPRHQIACTAFALCVWPKWTAAIRPLVPIDSEPSEVLEHRADIFCPAALRIQIFVAEYECAMRFSRTLMRDRKGVGMPHVQEAGWRGRDPPAIRLQA